MVISMVYVRNFMAMPNFLKVICGFSLLIPLLVIGIIVSEIQNPGGARPSIDFLSTEAGWVVFFLCSLPIAMCSYFFLLKHAMSRYWYFIAWLVFSTSSLLFDSQQDSFWTILIGILFYVIVGGLLTGYLTFNLKVKKYFKN